MNRYRFFLDFVKEEAWLNEMGRQGWELTRIGFGYTFREITPQDTLIRIDFRTFATQDEFINYCTLFADSGWQHIAGSRTTGAQYFKRLSAGSSEDIFSDELSQAERYKRFSHVWFVLAGVLLMLLVTLGSTGAADLRALVQPGRFYLTPGLWEKSGAAFWQAFWFETPFALFRALMLYSFPLAVAVYLTFAMKSHRLYQEVKNHVSAS